jgi:hypothetical protein
MKRAAFLDELTATRDLTGRTTPLNKKKRQAVLAFFEFPTEILAWENSSAFITTAYMSYFPFCPDGGTFLSSRQKLI